MQFNSLLFLPFFGFVLLLHNLRLSWSVRKANLLWLSYVFYAAWNPPFVLLLWLSTLADWYIGKALHLAEGKLRRRLLLLASLAVNLGMLSYFKYGAFLLDNFSALVGAAGIDWQPAALDIVLPVGISFYTFQTLSYTLDIFNRRGKPWNNFLDYALFVTFFPQLVAGPIVRARQFLPQCVEPAKVSANQFGWGLYLILIGLFEKVVLADGVLAPGVETIFDGLDRPGPLDGWIGCFGFLCQAFCDFSGYSLCAIGIAKCLGFDLPTNFRFPFAAVGFKAFWRRWHISLSTWLRDYVYASLRGPYAERTALRLGFNILVTWGLIGLWHGAAWRFLFWGLASGVLLLVEEGLRARVPQNPFWTTLPAQFCIAFVTFAGTCLTMLIFRAPNMSRLGALSSAMFAGWGSKQATMLDRTGAVLTFGTAIVFFLGHWVMRHSTLERLADRCPWPLKSTAIVAMVVLIILAKSEDRAFVYFQF